LQSTLNFGFWDAHTEQGYGEVKFQLSERAPCWSVKENKPSEKRAEPVHQFTEKS